MLFLLKFTFMEFLSLIILFELLELFLINLLSGFIEKSISKKSSVSLAMNLVFPVN